MAEAIHFQRVTIHLKNGTNLVLDLKPEDHQKVAFDAVPLIFTPAEKEPAQTSQTK